MRRYSLVILGLLLASSAFAGSQTVDCQSTTGSVQFSVGNGSNEVVIQVPATENSASRELRAPVGLYPRFFYNTEESDRSVAAIPVGEITTIRSSCEVMRVEKPSGEVCFGRERWSDTYRQTLLLSGKGALPLTEYNQLGAFELEGLNSAGYFVGEFTCHEYGVSSAGGCYFDEGDVAEWVDCSRTEY